MAVNTTVSQKSYRPGAAMAQEALTGIVYTATAQIIVYRRESDDAVWMPAYLDEDYALGGDGSTGAGWIRALNVEDDGVSFWIERQTDLLQQRQYPPRQPLPAQSIEGGFDKMAMAMQDMAREAARAIRMPLGETGLELPPAADLAGGFLAFDADGKPIASSGTGADGGLRQDLASQGGTSGAQLVQTAQGQSTQAALDQVTGATVTVPLARAQATRIALGAGQRAAGGGAAITSTAGGGMATLTGAGPSLRDMKLIGGTVASGTSVIGIGLNNVSTSLLRDITIDLSASNGVDLPGVNIPTGMADHFSFGLRIDTSNGGYGYLTNLWNTASTQDGHVLMGFNIKAKADAIEYNNPGNPLKHSVTWGGLLHAGYGGSGSGSGFALGIAHNQGWVAGGLVAKYSRREAVHIEDGCSFGVLSSLALRGCQYVGILASVGGAGANQAQATPLVVTGFSAEGPGSGTAGSAGVYWVYDPSGYNNRWPLTAGYVKGFETGLWLDGLGVVPADNVTVDDAVTVLKTSAGRHYGTVFSKDAATLFQVAATQGGRAGRFVQSDAAPTTIISKAGGAQPPGATVDGFAFPALAMAGGAVSIAPGYTTLDLFAAPVRMAGRLRLTGKIAGGGFFWESDVSCLDGANVSAGRNALSDALSVLVVGTVQTAAFNGSITAGSMVLTLAAAPSSGALSAGHALASASMVAGTRITRQISGTTGGAGTYLLDTPQTATASEAMTANSPLRISGGKVQLALYNGGASNVSLTDLEVEFFGTYYA